MGFFPIAFSAPWILIGLAALPAIWWLLRLTPPRPQREVFPPLRILAGVLKREETPSKTPWWLTLLRMLLIATVIFALSQPVLNPRQSLVSGIGPLAILVDNGWSSEVDWQTRVATLREILESARRDERPVSMVFTADQSHNAAPTTAEVQIERLVAKKVQPNHTNRPLAAKALSEAFVGAPIETLIYVTDGLAVKSDGETLRDLRALNAQQLITFRGSGDKVFAISKVSSNPEGMKVSLSRLRAADPITVDVQAQDSRGRTLIAQAASFPAGAPTTDVTLEAPLELRNDVARIILGNIRSAGTTRLLDESAQRKRVAILAHSDSAEVNSLLRQTNYISKAISQYAEIIQQPEQDVAGAIRDVLSQNPSVIFMADIGRLPPETQATLERWIEDGGSLVRFAGQRLASATAQDPLLPVDIRQGERSFGGALTWAEPQKLADFPEIGPFAGLKVDPTVTIKRQLLAEPSPELFQRTWASLADGTPLVTAKNLGLGRIILFHVSAEPSWSDLPLSGQFVEMLRQVTLSANRLTRTMSDTNKSVILAPFRLLTSTGVLTPETGTAKPLELTASSLLVATTANPPGLYGSEDGYVALNLFDGDTISPIDLSPLGPDLQQFTLQDSESIQLMPLLLLFALALLVADTVIMLVLNGALNMLRMKRAAVSIAVFGLAISAFTFAPHNLLASDAKPGDDAIIEALDATRLAYVVTGESDVDRLSDQGLRGLGDFIRYRTTFDPGEPAGVNLESDELAVYPIIYWPISASATMPSPEAIARIDAYMRAGGTVLFDTRDQNTSFSDANSQSPNSQRLQEILTNVEIPPLEQAPENHVLTRSFYLLKDFPGRYAGGALWIEASKDTSRSSTAVTAAGDGVTPIMITSNDFAGAWAIDESGAPVLPTVPSDPMQRNYAYRTGLNIMMYMLTGNYKADQVHVPALLERLGQ